MSIGKKYNHVSPFIFHAEKDFKYYSLKELYKANGPDQVYTFLALFINNKSKFGKQALAVTPKYYVNLPSHTVEDVQDMITDQEAIDQINAGRAGFKIRTYTDRNGGTSYSVEWMDIEAKDIKLPF